MHTELTNVNKRLHEAMGLCWHEADKHRSGLAIQSCTACGFSCYECKEHDGACVLSWHRIDYCSDISAAFELVEFMRKEGWDFDLIGNTGQLWMVEINKVCEGVSYEYNESLPMAICLAARKALGER